MSRDSRFMSVYRLESLKVSSHSAKFGGHRHCGSGDIFILVCRIILQYHLIKGLCGFMVRVPLRQSPSCQVWWSQTLRQWRKKSFKLSRDLTRPVTQVYVALQVGAHEGKSPFCQIWWPQTLWQWRQIGFGLSRHLRKPRDQRFV